ncbi:MAG: type II secretion system F family protein [Anaerolineales bacterium]|nr:type II secretion system F family protein [Anaerolineales bacterium]MCS7247057.1 type II secretion system F family protein [Anaerolineales bacterium]MDW8160868.1 type II secretion system F family protein [Anaerolineales bacterium]MDW8447370.1 type II secretion system F family protein [Anaerolineales bacterium]
MEGMLLWIIVGLVVFVLFGALILVLVGLRDAGREDPLQRRLTEFAARGEIATLEEIELSQPFSERVLIPLARRFGDFVARFTPQNALQNTARRLELAGNPRGLDPTVFWASRFLLAFLMGGLFLFLFSVGLRDWSWVWKFIVILVFMVIGFYIPEMLLTSRISRRQKEIRKAMPDALDLLTICVEAGLGFDGAMAKVAEKWDNELSLAFARALKEIQLGKLRREALRDMADRIGIPEMTSFVAAVIQSEQLGVSMAKVLRIQSDQMRIRRRQRAEEEAHKAPIKMLIPLALLIFPSICIVLMTPAFIMLMQSALRNLLFGD